MPNTNPTAAPTDYPPAVLKEAEDAGRHAFDEALRDGSVLGAAQQDAAEAYAAVLARHTVAARMAAAEPDGAYLAAAMTAAIGTGRGAHGTDCGCCACLAPLIDADPLTPEQDAALREQSAQAAREASAIATGIDVDDLRIYDPEPSPEIARLTAERDALAKRVEALTKSAKSGWETARTVALANGWGQTEKAAVEALAALAADDEAAR